MAERHPAHTASPVHCPDRGTRNPSTPHIGHGRPDCSPPGPSRRFAWHLVCVLLLLVGCAGSGAAPPAPSPPATSSSTPAPSPSPPATGASPPTPASAAPTPLSATATPDRTAAGSSPGVARRPDDRRVPLAPAPGELGRARFPQDAVGIATLFARLPPEIAGLPRLPRFDGAGPERIVAGYGERPGGEPSGPRLAVLAISVPNSGFYPMNWTADDVIAQPHERGALSPGTPLPCGARADEAPPTDGTASRQPGGNRRVVVGRAGPLFWSRENNELGSAGAPERTPICTVLWGMEGSPYFYGVRADSQEGLDAVLAAVVAAADAAFPIARPQVPVSPVSPPPTLAGAAWAPAAPLLEARSRHTATPLPDGGVQVVGGVRRFADTAVDTTERYDPATDRWRATAPLPAPRAGHTATLLADGQILVAGGGAPAFRYDPAADRWAAAGSLATPRSGHSSTLLPDGKVLVAGGVGPAGIAVAAAEVYDPATDAWRATGDTLVPRARHTATPLRDGRVLVTGGVDDRGRPTATAELYAPATGRWQATGAMGAARDSHAAVPLPDGHVLVAGDREGDDGLLDTAERYDPATGRWAPAARLTTVRVGHTATPLQDGTVLVVGGRGYDTLTGSYDPLARAEVYDPAADHWAAAGELRVARTGHTATPLPDGQVLIAGGSVTTPRPVNADDSAELYAAGPGGSGSLASPPSAGAWWAFSKQVATRCAGPAVGAMVAD